MDKIKLIEEPDCWCGPHSQLAAPRDFPQVPDDHFALDPAHCRDLERMIAERSGVAAAGFELRSAPPGLAAKQQQLMAAMDRSTAQLHEQPEVLRAAVRELWRANNIEVYDLSTVDYDHAEALRSNFAGGLPLDASDGAHLTQPRFCPPPRMALEHRPARPRAPAPSFDPEEAG